MPYINKPARLRIEDDLEEIDIQNSGELNYVLTSIIREYLVNHGKSYATYNEVVGVLECCKLELYRRLVAPHEDKKCEENGDVY